MMIDEFIARTGYKPSFEEYQAIEKDYYEFNGDKDAFCEYWKTHDLARKLIMQAISFCANKWNDDPQLTDALKEYRDIIGNIIF